MAKPNWNIRFSPKAERYLKNMDKSAKNRIQSAIESLLDDPFLGYPLHGELQGSHRLRVGNFRIIYRIQSSEKIIDIATIRPRGDVYK